MLMLRVMVRLATRGVGAGKNGAMNFCVRERWEGVGSSSELCVRAQSQVWGIRASLLLV